jgi:hypothetical protein
VASTYGARRGDPRYDRFRTGLTYRQVFALLQGYGNPNKEEWRYKRRGTVLGLWHQLKLELYRMAFPDTPL